MYSSRLSVALTNNVARESPAPKNFATSMRWGLLEHCITMLKRLFRWIRMRYPCRTSGCTDALLPGCKEALLTAAKLEENTASHV